RRARRRVSEQRRELLAARGRRLEGHCEGALGPRLRVAVEELLEARAHLLEHTQIGVTTVAGLGRFRQLAPHQLLSALRPGDRARAARAATLGQLDQAEPAVAADGERDLGLHAERDREVGADAVLEPAHHFFAELVTAARRDAGAITKLEYLGTEVALAAA